MMTTEETRQHDAALALDEAADRLVRQNVNCCLSTLVATLAQGSGDLTAHDGNPSPISDLAYQALDLAAPVDDYEEAARQAGWTVGDTGTQFIHEERIDPETKLCEAFGCFEGPAQDDWRELCDDQGLDPYQREIYEHWAVSEWLARKLVEEGERIDPDFAGLIVWSRTTTGQAISMDHCIRAIARKLHPVEAT